MTKKPTKVAHNGKQVALHQLEKRQKSLQGGRFRMINETLYTSTSSEAVKIFKDDPDQFNIYHVGFRNQVLSWPLNPVDVYIRKFKNLKNATIADMGCGEAALARSLGDAKLKEAYKVHSFDLVAANEYITACDIKHVPLENASVGHVVFCLSLMGTNFLDFITEASRILIVGYVC